MLGISLIIGGIFLLSWWGRFRQIISQPAMLLRDAGLGYAVVTGVTITASRGRLLGSAAIVLGLALIALAP